MDQGSYTFYHESRSTSHGAALTFRFLGPDPVEEQLHQLLAGIAAGKAPRDIEARHVDVKEEPGRRGPDGTVEPGQPQNEDAAQHLTGEMACFSNTPGGGALVVGIEDGGERIGTALDAEWLRHRIYEISDRRLTVDVGDLDFEGTRLLVLRVPEAVEPVRHRGRIRWRVGDHCEEVDAATWLSGRLHRSGFDWSAQPSGHSTGDIRADAVEIARRSLRQATGDAAAQDLAASTGPDLLRRLNVVTADDMLTNAGALLFVTTPEPAIDYIRRDHPGGDSTNRVRTPGPLVSQLAEVETAAQTANRVVHLGSGLVKSQVRALPSSAVREAIVNGVTHRDWASPQPTTVEHVGDTLTVTSPGGFVGGVSPGNIITHPSAPRYRSLAEALAGLRLAEREGIGVDRMMADMLALGHPPLVIAEMDGPSVRAALLGGDPDADWMEFLAGVHPGTFARDVDMLLLMDHLVRHGWVDPDRAAPVVQRSAAEAHASLRRVADARWDRRPVVVEVAGVPAGTPPAWRLSDAVRERLGPRLAPVVSPAGRAEMILAWAQARGRVSSTEVSDMAGIAVNYAGKLLMALEGEGRLEPGREIRMGRGFFYRPTDMSG